MLLVKQLKEKFKIASAKLTVAILIPTLQSPVYLCGPSISYLNFYLIMQMSEGSPLIFIEREAWYGCDKPMDLMSKVRSKGPVCYYPNGNATREKILAQNKQFDQGNWCKRSFVYYMMSEGFDEGCFVQGKKVAQDILAKPAPSVEAIPFKPKKVKVPYRGRVKKLIIHQGARAQAIASAKF